MFEDCCIVTATVRQAFPIAVRVIDAAGNELHQSAGAAAVTS